MGYRVGRVSPRAASSWSRWPDGCGFRGVFCVGRIFHEARPRERSDRGRFLPIGKKASSELGKAEGAKRPRRFFPYRQKSLLIPGCVQGAIT